MKGFRCLASKYSWGVLTNTIYTHTHTHKHKFNQVSLSISFRFIVFHPILDSFVSHRWWSLLLLLLWTKWNPMILSRFELMVSLCRLYSVQVLSVIRLKINKPKINNDKELKDWAQSIPIENRWDFFFLYHFLVKLRYRKFISIVVHTIHNTHAHTTNVGRSMRSDHMPMSHQWQNNQTHQSGLNGAYLHRIDAKVCCHFWGFDKSMKCKKGLAYYSIHKKKNQLSCHGFFGMYRYIRINVVILRWIIFLFTLKKIQFMHT